MTPPTEYLDLLTQPLFAHVAVTDDGGRPRSYPMWFDYGDGSVRLTNTTGRAQTKALGVRPDAAMSVIDPVQPYRYLGMQLQLVEVSPDPEGHFFYKLANKYGLDITLEDASDRVVLHLETQKFWKQ